MRCDRCGGDTEGAPTRCSWCGCALAPPTALMLYDRNLRGPEELRAELLDAMLGPVQVLGSSAAVVPLVLRGRGVDDSGGGEVW